MKLTKLFEMQKALDAKIMREKGLEGQDMLPQKILALQVELGELANEWRGFKYWSNRQTPNAPEYNWEPSVDGLNLEWRPSNGYKKYALLEEYVDCLHFILSIGLEIGVTNPNRENLHEDLTDATEAFQHAFNWCSTLDFVRAQGIWNGKGNAYERLVDVFLALGYHLGFTWEQIEQAYMDKNAVNHARQANGY